MSAPSLAPERFNIAHDLIARNLEAGRAGKIAYIDDAGTCTFAELAERVARFAAALHERNLQPEQRVLLCMLDTIEFPIAFLGCIWAGLVPVPVNTLLTPGDYAYMLEHSRARALIVSAACSSAFAQATLPASLARVIVSGPGEIAGVSRPVEPMAPMYRQEKVITPYAAGADDIAFWLYSSGSTGRPKGTVHLQRGPAVTAECYAVGVLGLREDDVCFSAAKLFFAYGLGNALTHPLHVGATTVLMAERATPDSVFRRLSSHPVTVFAAVPTLYASMLAADTAPTPSRLRLCISAGEALPAQIGQHWRRRFGVDIVDGLGSTEMLHIYLSNRPGDVSYGTSGLPVPGYEVRLADDSGAPVPAGELGELWVRGQSAALMYWADRQRSNATFQGEWLRSGDKYGLDASGRYVYAGRSDDMLKVSGIYVSPFEVESALVAHPDVLEAAVVGVEDEAGLIKPKAFIVLKHGASSSEEMVRGIQQFAKARLAPYKYPRWIEFVDALPKTATGKVQRFRLRATAPAAARPASGYFSLADANLEYRLVNDRAGPAGPWLVFLHEGLGSIAGWKEFPDRLCAATGCRGLVFSRAGYGNSSPLTRPRTPDFMHREAHDVLPAVLDAFAIRRCLVFSHSDGASIALLHAARFPDRVEAVVALAPHLFVEAVTVESIVGLRTAYRDADLKKRLARYHRDVDSAFVPWCEVWLSAEFAHWNIEREVAEVRKPVLVIQGQDDEFGTIAHAEAVRRATPHAEVLVLPRCGHSPHRDQEAAVIEATSAFFRRIGALAAEG